MKIKVVTFEKLISLSLVESLQSECEGEDDEYSEQFSEKDIFDSSESEYNDAKHRYQRLKEGSKYYMEYRKEVDNQMLLPRRMGFQTNKEKNGDMFLKSFYIGDRYADPFSKGKNLSIIILKNYRNQKP